MNHDPLCPPGWWMPGDDEPCAFCDLIARVREDERAAALRDATASVIDYGEERKSNLPFGTPSDDITAALRIAAQRIHDLQPGETR